MRYFFILAALPIAACSLWRGADAPRLVSKEEYLNRQSCWNGNDTAVEGILILRKSTAGHYVPWLMSPYCFTDDISAFYGHNPIPLLPDADVLKRAGATNEPVAGNTTTDQVYDDKDELIFAVQLGLQPHKVRDLVEPRYSIVAVEYLHPIDTSYAALLLMSPQDRWNVFVAARARGAWR